MTYVTPGDSMATIQSKMDSVNPGDTLVFTKGSYDFGGATIVGKSGVTVWADGKVVIDGAPGAGSQGAFNFAEQTGWTIGGKAAGAGFVFNGSLIDATGASDWAIGNAHFNGQSSNGYDGSAIRMNGASFGTIINNDFTGVGGTVVGMYNLTNITIDGNHFTDCYEPIAIQAPLTTDTTLGHDIIIQRNSFIGTQRAAIEVGPASSGSEYFSGMVVDNNHFDNFNNTAGPGTLLAISLVGQSAENTTITNNFIRRGPADAGEVGVAIEMTGTGTVSGNVISNFSYAALTYQSGWDFQDNVVHNDGSSPYYGFGNNGSGTGTFGTATVHAGVPATPALPVRVAWGGSATGEGTTTPDPVTPDPVAPTPVIPDPAPPVGPDTVASNPVITGTSFAAGTVTLAGTSEAGSTVFIYEGLTLVGTAVADAQGAWTTTGAADPNAFHAYGVVAKDAAGNVSTSEADHVPTSSGSSASVEPESAGQDVAGSPTSVPDTDAPAPTVTGAAFTDDKVILTGTSEAGSTVSVYEGANLVGTATADDHGLWTMTGLGDVGAFHAYGIAAKDVAGNVGHSQADYIPGSGGTSMLVGSSEADQLAGTTARDVIVGGAGGDTLTGGGGQNTFFYAAASDSTAAAPDTITDFHHGVDKIDFSALSGVSKIGGELSASGNSTLAAHSVGFLEYGGNTHVLVNTSDAAETVSATDAHAADMKIVLVGVHLGLTSSDFHHA